MKVLLLLFSLFYFSSAWAQSDSTKTKTKPLMYSFEEWQQLGFLQAGNIGPRSFDNRYEGVKGSPFWKKDFQEAIVSLHVEGIPDGKESQVKAQLDLEKHELLIIVPKLGNTIIVPCSQISSVQFLEDNYAFTKTPYNQFSAKTKSCGLAQLLYDGERFQLYENHNKVFKAADYKEAYSADRRYDEYKLNSRFWLKASDQELKKLKLSKKSLLKALPQYEKQINSIVKKEKLNLSSEEGMIKILKALETL